MTSTPEQEQLLAILEDNANMLHKAQVNLKKTPKARLTKGYIETRIKTINEYWTAFKQAHDELIKITPKTQRDKLPYFCNEDFFTCEDVYIVIQSELKDMYSSLTELVQEAKLSNTGVNVRSQQSEFVHLPRIQLPTFNSSYEQWPAFKDLFTSLVHENTSLSDVQKLHYLKTSMKGEAESLLQHIQVVGINYKAAWDLLNSRYGYKRLNIDNIMKRLFNQKHMTAQSAAQIKSLVDTTTECLNNLNNLKISTNSWDLFIVHLLVHKLDWETHKEWEQHVSDRYESDDCDELPTWKQLKKFMETKFRTLELVTPNTNQIKQIKDQACHVITPTTEKVCVMCNENHTLCHCKEFNKMEPIDRNNYVKQNQLCFNCLAPGHSVSNCKLLVSCRICHKRHHSLLHDVTNLESAASIGTSNSQPLTSQYYAAEEDEVQVNTMIASHRTTRQGVALLATAVVEATSEKGYTIPLRCLIDQGSQATFISEKAAQRLKLKRQPIRRSVVGVGSTRTNIKHVVQLQIRSHRDKNFSLSIQAYVMEKQLITKMPTNASLKPPWPHIRGLNLADPTYLKTGSLDLVLGVRECAQILQPELIKGPSGTPCAQNTSLGWILFGDITAKPSENRSTYHFMKQQVDDEQKRKSSWKQYTNNERKHTYSPRKPDIHKRKTPEHELKNLPDLKRENTKIINENIKGRHTKQNTKESVYLPQQRAVDHSDVKCCHTHIVPKYPCMKRQQISLEELHVNLVQTELLRKILLRGRNQHVSFLDMQQEPNKSHLAVKELHGVLN